MIKPFLIICGGVLIYIDIGIATHIHSFFVSFIVGFPALMIITRSLNDAINYK